MSVTFHVHPLSAQRYAHATGDLNPLYFDLEAARAAGYQGLLAPPTYVTSQNSWDAGPAEADLRYDGVNPGRFPGAVSPEATLMGGSQTLEIRRPVLQGEDLSVEVEAIDTTQRETSRGVLTFYTIEARFRDHRGDLVVVARDVVVTAPRS